MPLVRLTQEIAERAQPGELLCDDKVTGLLLLSQKRVKTFVVQREVKDPETGIRKTARVKLGHFPEITVQDARELAKEELRKMEKGRNPHAARNPDLTVSAAINEYIRGAVDLRPRTIQGYRYHLDHYIDPTPEVRKKMDAEGRKVTWPIIGHLPLADIGNKPTIVRNLHLELGKGPGHATANGVMRTISAAYNGMKALRIPLPDNPITQDGVIRWFKIQPRRRRITEFEDWATALQTIGNPIRRALRLFLLLTGQRDEATRTMRWKDVKDNKIHFPAPKGGESVAFDLPISPQVQTILDFVRTFSTEEWAFPGSEFVWPAKSKTGHIAESKEQRRAKLLNPHALRRTFISVGYGVAPNKYVSYFANHACKDTMTDEYFIPTMDEVLPHLTAIDSAILDKLGVDLAKLLGPQVFTTTQFKSASEE